MYFGGAIKVNSSGVNSYSHINFETPESSLNIKGLFRVTDMLSGNLSSINVQNVDYDRLRAM
jgi:hypothetical protein